MLNIDYRYYKYLDIIYISTFNMRLIIGATDVIKYLCIGLDTAGNML